MFVLVTRIILSRKSSNTMILDYMGLIINYLSIRRVGGFESDYMGIPI